MRPSGRSLLAPPGARGPRWLAARAGHSWTKPPGAATLLIGAATLLDRRAPVDLEAADEGGAGALGERTMCE